MTSGCGPEIPKCGGFEKAMLRNVWFSKGDNSQLMFFFSPRRVIPDSPSSILDVEIDYNALSIKMRTSTRIIPLGKP